MLLSVIIYHKYLTPAVMAPPPPYPIFLPSRISPKNYISILWVNNATLLIPATPMFERFPQLPSSKGEKVPVSEALNLLSLCNILLLSNALNPTTYLDDSSPEKRVANTTFDFNNISFKHRRSAWRCRVVCLDMFRWFRQHYVVQKGGRLTWRHCISHIKHLLS